MACTECNGNYNNCPVCGVEALIPDVTDDFDFDLGCVEFREVADTDGIKLKVLGEFLHFTGKQAFNRWKKQFIKKYGPTTFYLSETTDGETEQVTKHFFVGNERYREALQQFYKNKYEQQQKINNFLKL